jgi:hypothetical protein
MAIESGWFFDGKTPALDQSVVLLIQENRVAAAGKSI